MLVTDVRKGVRHTQGSTVEEILAELGESVETVLVTINGTLATNDQQIKEGDRVVLLPVVSGG